MNEGSMFESTPKKFTLEREGGSVFVELSEGLKPDAIFQAAGVAKSVIGDQLFELIVPEEGARFEIRPLKPDGEVPDELKNEIEEELTKAAEFF